MDTIAELETDFSHDVRDLYSWLREEPALRSRIRLNESAPPEGGLGPVADVLRVVSDAPEVVAAVASMVIAWLRFRTADVRIKIRHTKTAKEVEITAKRVKGLTAEQTGVLTAEIRNALSGGEPAGPDGAAAGGDARG